MVEFRDRRKNGPQEYEDFNNPEGGFYLTTAGYPEEDAWEGQPTDAKSRQQVHAYFRNQKQSKTWKEANQIAARRAGAMARKGRYSDLLSYGRDYEAHLVRVMATKGPQLAAKHGEIKHVQDGYGRI